MGKKDQKQARQDINTEKQRVISTATPFIQGTTPNQQYATAGYKNMAETGGETEADRLNELGYRTFAETGGITDPEAARIRTRASLAGSSMFGAASDRLARMRSLQGGYSPGYAAQMARFARQGGQSASEAALGADIGIAEQRRQGKLAGLAGSSGLQGQLRAAKLAGLGGISQQTMMQLQAMGLSNEDIARLLGYQTQLAFTKGPLDTTLDVVGAAAGGLSGLGWKPFA